MARGVVAWALVLATVRVVVTQPERCGLPSSDAIDGAIAGATDWAIRTQHADGSWTYRFDVAGGRAYDGYELVRHAGLTMALYQVDLVAHRHAARDAADRASAFARTRTVSANGGVMLVSHGPDAPSDTGASALWLAGLALRRLSTGDGRDDDLLRGLGRFLVGQIEPNGAVAAEWDPTTGAAVAGSRSPFYTGETAWALALMHRALPGEGWDAPTRQVLRYLATDRRDAEDWFPEIPDHWAAHTLEEVTLWPGSSGTRRLDPPEVAYARRLGALESMQIRYESQRTGRGWSRLSRGEIAVPAGLGAIAESLAALWHIGVLDEGVGDLRDALAERALCATDLLVSRQIADARAATLPDPDMARGAWERAGDTQIDDQQHALSGLLAVRVLRYGPFPQEAP